MSTAIIKTLDDLKELGGLSGVDVANVAEVSKATASRWSTGKSAPPLSTQLVLSDLRYVVDSLAEFYGPEETRLWLYSMHPLLGSRRPMDLIHEGETTEVLAAVEQLAAMTYV